MGRYAVVDEDGTVLNVVEWDGETPYEPPFGQQLVDVSDLAKNVAGNHPEPGAKYTPEGPGPDWEPSPNYGAKAPGTVDPNLTPDEQTPAPPKQEFWPTPSNKKNP